VDVPPDNLSPLDVRLVERAIDSFFAAQENGTWPRSRPLHPYPEVGSAYCYDYETLAQLLQAPNITTHLIRNLGVSRLRLRLLRVTANTLPNGGKAWSSGHHPHLQGAESWSTASVYQFAHHLDRLVAEAIRRTTFEYVGSVYAEPKGGRSETAQFRPSDFWTPPSFRRQEAVAQTDNSEFVLAADLREMHRVEHGEGSRRARQYPRSCSAHQAPQKPSLRA